MDDRELRCPQRGGSRQRVGLPNRRSDAVPRRARTKRRRDPPSIVSVSRHGIIPGPRARWRPNSPTPRDWGAEGSVVIGIAQKPSSRRWGSQGGLNASAASCWPTTPRGRRPVSPPERKTPGPHVHDHQCSGRLDVVCGAVRRLHAGRFVNRRWQRTPRVVMNNALCVLCVLLFTSSMPQS